MVLTYKIPDYFPISESKRVVIEVLDEYFKQVFDFHILEPMSEVKEVVRAKANLRA